MKNNQVYWMIGFISLLFMIAVLYLNYLYASALGKDYQGIFGDMFGASNALFTGLSFVGVIIAILLQRQDINNQRIDSKIQNFETIFFNMVNAHHQIVSDLRSNSYTTKNGEKIFTYYIAREVFKQHIGYLLLNVDDDTDTFDLQYSRFHKDHGDNYGHYFKNLYQILRFVDHHKFSTDEKEDFKAKNKYIEIIWRQLSDSEIAMIFYHCAHSKMMPTFKDIIEKYTLLEDANDMLLFDEIKKLYSEKAFNKTAP